VGTLVIKGVFVKLGDGTFSSLIVTVCKVESQGHGIIVILIVPPLLKGDADCCPDLVVDKLDETRSLEWVARDRSLGAFGLVGV